MRPCSDPHARFLGWLALSIFAWDRMPVMRWAFLALATVWFIADFFFALTPERAP